MSVYVDQMLARYGRMVMCHMLADSREELNQMADRIGVARKWIQNTSTHREHYDICLAKRRMAVAAGAKEITTKELAVMLHQRKSGAAHPSQP